jgi:phytoene dehydrogenase-like protein
VLGAAAALSAAALRPLVRRAASPPVTGELLGASHQVGHLLRGGQLPAPTSERKTTVAIVGGGISGLSAGWKLAKAGLKDFEILELEPECGGNSRSGENEVSRFPWGAHYVPLPSPESRAVRELFEELGVIEGHGPDGRPIYKEEFLCFSPQERLFLHGRWQEGLLPLVGATRKDLDEYERFRGILADYRERRGTDGRRAFAIPMELSSRDSDLLALDRLSIREFLLGNGFTSAGLHWYVDYACRDDFGCRAADVSAWAGIHYFACRGEDAAVLTWPEGNGWLVARLYEKLRPQIRTDALVHAIASDPGYTAVHAYDPRANRTTRVVAERVVFAAPKHLLPFTLAAAGRVPWIGAFEYAPWMVANLTLRAFPESHDGPPLCWDNVIHDSESLGYVVATHQSLRSHLDRTVFTYYLPLAGADPARERKRLLDTPWSSWEEQILGDLAKPHPDIRDLVTHLDVWRWGHAMVRPRPGFLWGEARRRAAEPIGNIHFAHSDLSGFSLFEEAQYRGVAAAEQVLEQLRVPYTSSL